MEIFLKSVDCIDRIIDILSSWAIDGFQTNIIIPSETEDKDSIEAISCPIKACSYGDYKLILTLEVDEAVTKDVVIDLLIDTIVSFKENTIIFYKDKILDSIITISPEQFAEINL